MTLCLRLNNWVIATTAAHKALAKTIGLAGGISVNQYRILARLQAFERFDQMRSLAKTLSLHPSTVTMTIKELEAMNLVKTQWDKDDRRNTVVLCTERSVQLIKDIDREIIDQVRQIWELYTTDELLLTYYDSFENGREQPCDQQIRANSRQRGTLVRRMRVRQSRNRMPRPEKERGVPEQFQDPRLPYRRAHRAVPYRDCKQGVPTAARGFGSAEETREAGVR